MLSEGFSPPPGRPEERGACLVYCGHNKIALASQRQISQALYELMLEKRFAEISISEICRRADVSRQTFYKLYESKENILLDYLDGKGYAPEAEPLSPEENSGTEACSSGRDFCLKSFCCEYSRYLVEKRELLRLLAENNITHLLTDSMYRSMVSCPYFLPDLSPEKRLYRYRRHLCRARYGGFRGFPGRGDSRSFPRLLSA